MNGFALKLAAAAIVFAAAHVYLWLRLARGASLPRWLSGALGVLLGVLFFSVPVALLARRHRWLHPFLSGAYVWLGLSFLLFWSVALTEIVRAALALWRRARGKPIDAERRRTLGRVLGGGAAALGFGTATAGAFEALNLIVQRAEVPLARLPASLSGFRIAQISDLHVGPTIHRDYVERVVASVNALEPDLIAITGDLVDGTVAALRDAVAPLAGLRARHGVFFVTGNHEYYAGVDPWLEHIRSLGIRVLKNERVSVGDADASFDLAGVEDFGAGAYPGHRYDLGAALAGRDADRELVLLAHQPRSVRDAAVAGVGLQLSGHTHGGQIFPLGLFLFDQPFIAGLHKLADTWVYVSRGAGFWGPPMRVGAPPEIAEVTLLRAT